MIDSDIDLTKAYNTEARVSRNESQPRLFNEQLKELSTQEHREWKNLFIEAECITLGANISVAI